MQLRQQLSSAFTFSAPFAVLLVLWALLVPYFNVNPRLFPAPGLGDAGRGRRHPGRLSDRAHRCEPAARGRRHGPGARDRHSTWRCHGREPDGLELSDTPVPLLLRARRHRLDPYRDAMVRLRLRRHHVRHLQCGVLHRHLQHAARRLDHSHGRCAMRPPRSAQGAGRC